MLTELDQFFLVTSLPPAFKRLVEIFITLKILPFFIVSECRVNRWDFWELIHAEYKQISKAN
ncbi:hypothetical protein BpHYR1_023817 [Brachionus plicatilis]|uniref:Uncharacterized protein n=1 Tax=Brachionus plicatilis TaxID=10195 RepID=A0A3M7PNJ8_BRAPC|nr:hypothetical protein BpHYR1_023817 [Brachionus plicatilis]